MTPELENVKVGHFKTMPVSGRKGDEFQREIAATLLSRPHRHDDPPLAGPGVDLAGFR
jgi:hypothetical protein